MRVQVFHSGKPLIQCAGWLRKGRSLFCRNRLFWKSAENIAKFFSKGKPILVEGRLRQESWQDKQTGQNRTKLMVVLERFEFVGGGFAAAPEESGGAGSRAQAPKVDQSNQSDFQARYLGNAAQDELEDDIPF